MSYILSKTNGQTVAVVEDASVDTESTSLSLIGKNYSGYGLVIDQNFIRLLENFSNSTPPSNPLQGQLWFDSTPSNRRLNICVDGSNYKTLANIKVQSNRPSGSSVGDLWWDTANGQLKAYDGTRFSVVGPATSSAANASWEYDNEIGDADPSNTPYPVIKGLVSSNPVAVVARLDDGSGVLIPKAESNLNRDFSNGIRPGITLPKCDSNGSSEEGGYYFWGTASEALSSKAKVVTTSSNANFYITFVSTATDGNYTLQTTSTFYFNPSSNVLNVTASAARYADLAERYEADAVYTPGTVVVVGGEKEITVTRTAADPAVAGVISKMPAYMMNSEAGTDETHPYVALKGRVHCKVYGPVTKGDLLVTSRHPGYACTYVHGDHPKAAFATALESFSGEFGIIEVKV